MSTNPLAPSTFCGTSFALRDCETPHEVERWVRDLSEAEIQKLLGSLADPQRLPDAAPADGPGSSG